MLSAIETEIVVLKAVWDQISAAANATIFKVIGTDPDSEIRFETSIHQRFFNIILVDLLSETDELAPLKKRSFLEGLADVSSSPLLGTTESAKALSVATEDFSFWLTEQIQVNVWLPSINKEAELKLSRSEFIKMTGNLSKHSFLRTFRVAKQLRKILDKSDIKVSLEDANLALTDFYERFHIDILSYHSSTVAEFLNNIRWAIYEYLQPEFIRSFERDTNNSMIYKFNLPLGADSKYAQQLYWDLMNDVRTEPAMQKFKVTRWLKLRY